MHHLALSLGINLRRARTRLNFSRERVATAVDLTVEEYKRIEDGNFPPSVDVFLTLCTLLDAHADELLNLPPPRPPLHLIRGGLSGERSLLKPPSER